MLQNLLGYNPKRKAGINAEETIVSVDSLDSWVATAVQCLLDRKMSGGLR